MGRIGSEIPLDHYCEVVRRAEGRDRIVVNGGEPLLHPDIVPLLTRSKETGAQVVLFTNGTLLSDHDFCDRILRTGIDRITIPIHGGRGLHDETTGVSGSFDKVMVALKSLLARDGGPEIELKFIVTKSMVEQGFSIPEFVKSLPNADRLGGLVITGQVNTRVSHGNGFDFVQTPLIGEYLSDSVLALAGSFRIKLFDVKLCKMTREFDRWLQSLTEIGEEPEYECKFFDAKCKSPHSLRYGSTQRDLECSNCKKRHYCRSVLEGCVVMEISKNSKSVVLE